MQAKIAEYTNMKQKVREESFQETEIGLIPSDWKAVDLRDVAQVKSGGNAPQGGQYFRNGKYPFVRVQHFDGSHDYVDKWDLINDSAVKDCRLKLFPKGAIVFPKSGASIRLEKRAMLPVDCYVVSHLAVLLPKENLVDNKFLLCLLKSIKFTSQAGGTTLPYLNLSRISETNIPLPPLLEQQKIAKVLGTIQRATEQQDTIIEAAKNLKKSLMQKLFTEGLGHTEFKETQIGVIPEDWEIKTAEEICLNVTDGTHDTPKPMKSGYYLVTSKHIKEGLIDFSEAYFISESDFNEINRRSEVHPSDVIFSMIGTIGNVVVVKEEYPKFAIKNVGLFKTNKDSTKSYWLYYYFQSPLAHEYIKNNTKGTSQKYVPLYALRNFPVLLSPIKEMQEIVHILNTVDKKIEVEERKKATLNELFKTMLHKLMTGEIRLKDVEV